MIKLSSLKTAHTSFYTNTKNNICIILKCVRQILVTLTVHTSLLKILTIQIANWTIKPNNKHFLHVECDAYIGNNL